MKAFVVSTVLAIAALAMAGDTQADPTCAAEPSCNAAPSCCNNCCCPQCGCHEGMIPVCHSYCTTKKVTKYHYCCICEEKCIPGRFPCCDTCGCGSGCCDKGCTAGCGCNEGCGCEEGHCDCMHREVHHLVKIPYQVDVPVRKCTIEWVCPKCGCNCGCTEKEMDQPAPSKDAPAKSTEAAPLPPTDVSYAAPGVAHR